MSAARAFYCPMHSDVHTVDGGQCPHCQMNLVPEGSRMGIVMHVLSNPVHLALMAVVMIAIMTAVMMLMR